MLLTFHSPCHKLSHLLRDPTRSITSFPWALVQGSRTGSYLTFKEYSLILAMRCTYKVIGMIHVDSS